jgi:hypothetical protein
MAVIHPDGSTSSLEVDFALALLNGIESAKKDSAQLRHIVYELARLSLEREVRKQEHDGSPSVNVCETPRLMLAFEAAIGHAAVQRLYRLHTRLHPLSTTWLFHREFVAHSPHSSGITPTE